MPEDIHLDAGAYALEALDADDREAFERHLATCAACRREVARLREVAQLLREGPDEDPPVELRARTLAAVRAEPARTRSEAGRGGAVGASSGPWARLRPRAPLLAGVTAALAAAAAALVLVLPSGVPGAPSVGAAADLADLAPTVADIRVDPDNAKLLAREGDEVAFPNWEDVFGWRATGGRADDLEGRTATTTFYDRVGTAKQVAYTVVSGEPLRLPEDVAMTTVRHDEEFHVVRDAERVIVVFERLGHTVVLSGDAGTAEMLRLAAWAGGGAVPF